MWDFEEKGVVSKVEGLQLGGGVLGRKVRLICEFKQRLEREIRSSSKRKGSWRRILGSKNEETQW